MNVGNKLTEKLHTVQRPSYNLDNNSNLQNPTTNRYVNSLNNYVISTIKKTKINKSSNNLEQKMQGKKGTMTSVRKEKIRNNYLSQTLRDPN